MDGKELLKQFRQAGWGSMAAVEAFVAEVGHVSPDDLGKLMGILATKGLPGDSGDAKQRYVVFAKLAERSPSRELFVPFVRALKSGDVQLANAVAPLIPRVNNVNAHGELCDVLNAPEPYVRRLAAQLLKQVGGSSAFQRLTELCAQPMFLGRNEAMDVVVGIGKHNAIPALSAVIDVGSASEKLQALQYLSDAALMAKDGPAALVAIAKALADETEKVCMQAIVAFTAMASEDEFFSHIGPAIDSPSLPVAKAALQALRKFDSPRVLEALERKLRMGPTALRLEVLGTLEAIGNDTVLPAIVGALAHKQPQVRARAAEVMTTLATTGKIDVARTILWLLRSKDVNVRRMAVDIAKRVGDPSGELAPRLLRHLRDEDWWVRERVMDALVVMAGRQLTRHMIGYLQDPSEVVRRYAVDALERIKDPAAVGALVRIAQGDKDWWVRERAIETLGTINDPRTVPYIVDLMKRSPELSRACLGALRAMKAAQAVGEVIPILNYADPELRLLALGFLEAIEDTAQGATIMPLLQDADHRIRGKVRELLIRWHLTQASQIQVEATNQLGSLERLLVALVKQDGDDLILAGGQPPFMKKIGRVVPLSDRPFSAEEVRAILLPTLTPKQIADLEALKDVDFSFEVRAEGLRFRANVFQQAPGLSAVLRVVKNKIPVLEELGLPPVVRTFGEFKSGLVLVGGPTGSGKSTTLAGIIDYINRTTARHIFTVEDPVEIVHAKKRCLVNQRELGAHTLTFDNALRATLRQDADVILVGEMRDLPTIQFAITAAETGCLVLGTIHTVSVDNSVDRLVSAFPPGQQSAVRGMLADSLRAVMCQFLLKRKDGQGRVLAAEIMLNNDAIASLIRKGKAFQIPSVIATQREAGMQSMDWELERLFKDGKITAEEAYMKAANKKNFEWMIDDKGADKEKPSDRAAAGAKGVDKDRKANPPAAA